MPRNTRFKTKIPGVFYIEVNRPGLKPDRHYFIRFRKNGKIIEEKAGHASEKMSPSAAAIIRSKKISGEMPLNSEIQEAEASEKVAPSVQKPVLSFIYAEYLRLKGNYPALKTDRSNFNNYIESKFGDLQPPEISAQIFNLHVAELLNSKSPQTVKHVVRLLVRLVRWGCEHIEGCQPLSFTPKAPVVKNIKTEDMTEAQLSKLWSVIEACDHIQARCMIKLILFTGLRKTEAYRLQWLDVDFDRNLLTLRDTKSGDPKQFVPMSKTVKELLEAHPRIGDFVFSDPHGRPHKNLNKIFKKIRDDAGLPPDFRPLHGLRHFFASTGAADSNIGLRELSGLLRHSDSRMTDRYSHIRATRLRQGSEAISQTIENIVNKN